MFNDSKSVYEHIMSLKLPQEWTTPQPIKNAYQTFLNTQKFYQPQINQKMADYADNTPITSTGTYKKLVDAYTKEYQNNAALAANEAVKASNASDAGYGNTYSQAATDQAYTGYLADRGAAYPQLMAAAADAVNQNKAGVAAGINAMTNQRSLNTNAAKQMFSSKFSDYTNAKKSQNNAYDTLTNSLLSLYSAQKAAETAASSGGSGGGGRRRASSSGGENDVDTGGGSPENSGGHDQSYQDSKTLYQYALKEIKKYGGSGLMTPDEFNRRQTGYSSYDEYVKERVALAERSYRLNKSRGRR